MVSTEEVRTCCKCFVLFTVNLNQKQSNWLLPLVGNDAPFGRSLKVWLILTQKLVGSLTDTCCHRNGCIILIACWVPKGSWSEAFSTPTSLKQAVGPSRHGHCGWCWTGCSYGCNPVALASIRQRTLAFMAFLAIPHTRNLKCTLPNPRSLPEVGAICRAEKSEKYYVCN